MIISRNCDDLLDEFQLAVEEDHYKILADKRSPRLRRILEDYIIKLEGMIQEDKRPKINW